MDQLANRELRIMHACELGAVGVYRGHKCVARYVFRRAIPDLDDMRSHELDHVDIFRRLLDDRASKPCFGYRGFFWGGLIYGVAIGLLGLRAIGESTRTIESIVIVELDIAMQALAYDETIVEVLQGVKQDEMEHQTAGDDLAGKQYWLSGFVAAIATAGAYSAKYLSSKL